MLFCKNILFQWGLKEQINYTKGLRQLHLFVREIVIVPGGKQSQILLPRLCKKSYLEDFAQYCYKSPYATFGVEI